MTKYIIILGCGSSLGVPRIDGYWGNCKKNNKKNIRTRCSIFIKKDRNQILIDTSPDLRQQLLSNNIKYLSYVIYTHEHADQTHGINDLRALFFLKKEKIKIYGNKNTVNHLRKSFKHCFISKTNYQAFLESYHAKQNFNLGNKKSRINFKTIALNHGKILSNGYIFEKAAYLSDCNGIPKKSLKKLYNLNTLIIDCLKFEKHPTHFNLDQAIKMSEMLKPKKTILTNLHSDLDYNFLLKNLPRNVKPAYDGLKIKL